MHIIYEEKNNIHINIYKNKFLKLISQNKTAI